MKNPGIKQNPHPTECYEITPTIKNAPGPFDPVTRYMQYEVSNEQCAPEDESIGRSSRGTHTPNRWTGRSMPRTLLRRACTEEVVTVSLARSSTGCSAPKKNIAFAGRSHWPAKTLLTDAP